MNLFAAFRYEKEHNAVPSRFQPTGLMSDSPASPRRSRVSRILLGLAVLFVGLPLLAFLVISISFFGVPGLDGETDRYRTAVAIVVDDNGREIRNTVVGECGRFRSSNWNTSIQHGASHDGDQPFVVLRDRSLLILVTCRGACLLAARALSIRSTRA